MGMRVWETGILMLLLWGSLTCAVSTDRVSSCPTDSFTDSILGFRDFNCPVNSGSESHDVVAVIEGDEVSLQKALNMVDSNEYVAVLFYASWCPFSRTFRPGFSMLASLHPSIAHVAIEESAIRPITLSKYGVHGFPTLFLLNSSMRVRYHGSRTLGSLIAFYGDITGIKSESWDEVSLNKIGYPSNHEKHSNAEEESYYPFSWARSPEHLLRQEMYLVLATVFVLLRFIYLFLPTLLVFVQFIWRSLIRYVKMESMLEHPRAYLNRAIQLLNSLKEPCKRSNLQEGALNARAWASKSLATVSIGDASTSRGACCTESR